MYINIYKYTDQNRSLSADPMKSAWHTDQTYTPPELVLIFNTFRFDGIVLILSFFLFSLGSLVIAPVIVSGFGFSPGSGSGVTVWLWGGLITHCRHSEPAAAR